MAARRLVTAGIVMTAAMVGCSHGDSPFTEVYQNVKAKIPTLELTRDLSTTSEQNFKVELTWNQGTIFTAKKCEALILPLDDDHPAIWEYIQDTDNHPGIFMRSGYLFLAGNMPLAKSELVSAAAEGSQIVLQVDDRVTPSVHRVVFLDGYKVEINEGEDDHRVLVGEDDLKHFHAYSAGTGPGPKTHVDDEPEVKNFIYSTIDAFAVTTSTPRPRP